MSERRMFSKRLCSSARFLKMPFDSQLLYYHLALHADDDGVVEAFQVMRMTGASEDNLRVLAAKDLVKVLNDDMVTWITDWHEHNAIRSDRLQPSMYRPLLLQLIPDIDLTEPRDRADRPPKNPNRLEYDGTSQGRPGDGVGEERVGKVKSGEESASSLDKSGTKERIDKALARDKALLEDEDKKRDKDILSSATKSYAQNVELSDKQSAWVNDALSRSEERMKDIYEAERIRNQPRPRYTFFFDDNGNYLSEEHERQHKAQQEREKASASTPAQTGVT